jgi:uncharacterized membrane protein YfcA
MEPSHLALLAILLGSYTAGTMLGFGTTVLTVTFAAHLVPIEVLLPVMTPLNFGLGSYIVARHRQHIEWRLLLRRVLPLVVLGLPIGMLLFNLRGQGWLKVVLGLLVASLASLELWAFKRGRVIAPLGRRQGSALLFAGGIVHGLFVTGGPFVVYVLGRELTDKGAFRSTVSMLFLPLTVALWTNYYLTGLVDETVVKLTAAAVVPVLAGMALGEWAHTRVDNRSFKLALWVALLIGGASLALRPLVG